MMKLYILGITLNADFLWRACVDRLFLYDALAVRSPPLTSWIRLRAKYLGYVADLTSDQIAIPSTRRSA